MATNDSNQTKVSGSTPEAKPEDATPGAGIAADPEEIQRAAAQERARIELEAASRAEVEAAQTKAEEIIAQAHKEADAVRAEAGLVPQTESPSDTVDGGTISVRYLGTSDRFYVGNDKENRAVYAIAGGEPVKVTAEIRDRITRLPNDRFEEVK